MGYTKRAFYSVDRRTAKKVEIQQKKLEPQRERGRGMAKTDGKTGYRNVAFATSARPSAVIKTEKAGFFVISATGDVILGIKKAFSPQPLLT